MNATMVRCAGKINSGAVFGRRSHRNKVKAAAASTGACTASGRDYYKVLSLEHSVDVGAEEIRRAYRRLALRYHPDACPPSLRAESTELFLELRRAYETLSNPALRVRYDAELRTGEAASSPPQAGAFGRDVWEAQLCMLRVRSERRQKARGGGRRFQASPV